MLTVYTNTRQAMERGVAAYHAGLRDPDLDPEFVSRCPSDSRREYQMAWLQGWYLAQGL